MLGTLLGVRAQAGGALRAGRGGVRPALSKLALGRLLADVARPVLAADAAARADLGEDDLDRVRTHPIAGVALLGGDEDPLVRSVVRGHHERWDGAGHPRGVPARDLHPFARASRRSPRSTTP